MEGSAEKKDYMEETASEYLNSEFDGEYHCSVELEKGLGILTIKARKGAERPKVGLLADQILEEVTEEGDEPHCELEYKLQEGEYHITVALESALN